MATALDGSDFGSSQHPMYARPEDQKLRDGVSAKILIADDHRMFGEAIRTVLEREPGFVVVGTAEDGARTLKQVAALLPDVVVLDVEMPGMTGIEVAAELRASGSSAKVVALSAHRDIHTVRAMLNAGAVAFVPKSATRTELVRAINAVVADQHYISPELSAHIASATTRNAIGRGTNPQLGARECEVLQCLASGLRSPQIATRMSISVSTVEVHRRNIMRKLNLHSVAELTKYAIREGLSAL